MSELKERSKLLAEIGEQSLLEVVPGLSELVLRKGDVRLVPAKKRICRQGAEIKHYLMPLTESLRLVDEAGGGQKAVGLLQKHRSLALRQTLDGEPYPYSVMTEQPSLVLLLPRRDFVDLVRTHPNVEHYLQLVSNSAALRSFKQFLGAHKVGREQVLEVFSAISAQEQVLEAGWRYDAAEPRLCFVSEGELEFSTADAAGSQVKGKLTEGSWFGGQSLVPPFRLSYQVTATRRTRYQVATVSEIEPVLARLGLIDRVYDEPWIQVRRAAHPSFAPATGIATALPGRPLDDLEAARLGLPVLGPERTLSAPSDEESFAASLCNIAALLDVRVNETTIRNTLALNPKLGLLRLAETLEPFGLLAKALSAEWGELAGQPLPGLVMFGPRLCVLLGVRRRKAYLLDPLRGNVEVAAAEFTAHWDRRLLWVHPGDTESRERPIARALADEGPKPGTQKEKKEGRRLLHRAFGAMALRLWGPLASALGLTLGGFLLTLLTPLFAQTVLDEVLTLRDVTTLWSCILGMALATLLTVLVATAKTLVLSEFSFRYDHLLSAQFYRHALSLPTRVFGGRKAGSILARLSEIGVIRDFLSASSIDSITDLVSVVVFTGVLCLYGWKIALVPVGALLIMCLVQLVFKDRLARNYDEAFEAESLARSLLTEQISAMTTVKALGAETTSRREWERAGLRGVEASRTAQLDVTAFQGLTGFISRLTMVIGISVAASLALDGKLSPGELLAVTMYLEAFVAPLNTVSGILSQVEQVRVAFSKLTDVVQASPEQPAVRAADTYALPMKGKIRFERVSFRYAEDAPWVLRDLSFTIYPHQLVAVVGRSGCGKTTLANLIAGNLKPTSGRIFFDDFDSAFLSLPALRQQIGFIVQRRDLFAGTIRDNIAFTDDAPDPAAVEKAAHDAAAAEFIAATPAGYDHYLGEGGLGLSGGQMQRLSIARTLYREPKVLLMDEATSALDFEAEQAILENMGKILAGKTTVAIAHRLSTVRRADNILVMKDGTIVEQGSHAELSKAGGHYAELFSQRAGAEG